MTRPAPLARRHEFVLYFDVADGNPNGDPDAGNMPRLDPETGHGLVSDVCLKRKIRNYVELAKGDGPQFRIYVTEGAILNDKHREAYVAVRPDDPAVKDAKTKKLSPNSDEEAARLRRFMCDNFFDIRTFGAVLSTGINAGQVRGPVQMNFARSVEPVLPLEISITRMAATNEAEKKTRQEGDEGPEGKRGDARTMGRKHVIPYGLYRAHGYVSAPLASHPVKGTGFSDEDLDLLFQALRDMFEHDRSAARGAMATRKLVVFRHAGELGNAHADKLFARVGHARAGADGPIPIGDPRLDNARPARSFDDYVITVDRSALPEGIEVFEDDEVFGASRLAAE
ncbi:type I-C CRISPR-associated protein Cas7/Csd2 [Phenylobacterium sp.]|uniref:type I-C CRISPR-associated protein Cas7/Csd2 n=1 Tax=Phenylobacterium sp. TaxID=1871053 RepID=UPI0025E9BBE0|nr:type I-C CRISPR-associated protein Cas7/Csd2 [Phenylobacterium sp.]MBX3482385.1 type I-C CRISPR-associated protein Cas7/Csd2 [Phenylobacterium sp.]MCW5759920.1 type I-C CRISPR-associated protein Cas7/Csd2 [Phenylobacterium sp.]